MTWFIRMDVLPKWESIIIEMVPSREVYNELHNSLRHVTIVYPLTMLVDETSGKRK